MNPIPTRDNGDEMPEDDTLADAPIPDLEQVATSTSRKLLILLCVGAILLYVFNATPIGRQIRDWDTLAGIFNTEDFRGEVYFLVISTVLTAVGVPRLLFYALGGFAFGFWEGLFWSLCSSVIGSFAAFRIARWGSREWLIEHFGKRRFFNRIAHAEPTVASVALMRMLPVSNAIINFGLSLSHAGNRAFLIGSLIGFLPQGIVAVIIGSGIAKDVPWAGALQIGGAGILLLGLFVWSKKQRSRDCANPDCSKNHPIL